LSIATTVASDEALILTRLFPIKIVMSKRCGLALTRCKSLAFLDLRATKARTFAEDREKRAISAPEKNPDKRIKIIRMYIDAWSIAGSRDRIQAFQYNASPLMANR